MPRQWEDRLAIGGFALGLGFAIVLGFCRWPEGAFWSVASGFTALYGFGCFRVWYTEHPTDEARAERHAVWFIHMYWLNALGCFVGWCATRLLYARCVVRADLGTAEVLLFLAAFLGLVGYLPFAVVGLAVAVRNLGAKALDLAIPKV
jgi:hypothetical protein